MQSNKNVTVHYVTVRRVTNKTCPVPRVRMHAINVHASHGQDARNTNKNLVLRNKLSTIYSYGSGWFQRIRAKDGLQHKVSLSSFILFFYYLIISLFLFPACNLSFAWYARPVHPDRDPCEGCTVHIYCVHPTDGSYWCEGSRSARSRFYCFAQSTYARAKQARWYGLQVPQHNL